MMRRLILLLVLLGAAGEALADDREEFREWYRMLTRGTPEAFEAAWNEFDPWWEANRERLAAIPATPREYFPDAAPELTAIAGAPYLPERNLRQVYELAIAAGDFFRPQITEMYLAKKTYEPGLIRQLYRSRAAGALVSVYGPSEFSAAKAWNRVVEDVAGETAPDGFPTRPVVPPERVRGQSNFQQVFLPLIPIFPEGRRPSLAGVDLHGCAFKALRLPAMDFNFTVLDDIRWEDCNLSRSAFAGASFSGALLKKTVAVGATFRATHWRDAGLTACRLLGGSLAGSKWIRADVRRGEIVGANVTGWDLNQCFFHAVRFAELDFVDARLSNSTFRNCAFDSVDLTGIHWRGLSTKTFEGCTFRRTRLPKAAKKILGSPKGVAYVKTPLLLLD